MSRSWLRVKLQKCVEDSLEEWSTSLFICTYSPMILDIMSRCFVDDVLLSCQVPGATTNISGDGSMLAMCWLAMSVLENALHFSTLMFLILYLGGYAYDIYVVSLFRF